MSVETDLVVMVPVAEVTVPDGRRRVNSSRVAEIADSISDIGLLQPIIITEDKVLVAGQHRLRAFKHLRWETIPAIMRDWSEVDAQLAEIDENLLREDLSPSDRARLTARRKQLYLAKHPQTGHGKAPGAKGSEKGGKAPTGNDDNLSSLPPTFTEETAGKSGKNRRTIERDARRGEKVAPEVLTEIAGSDLDTGVNLDVLSRMDPEQQRAVVAFAKEKGIVNLKVAARNLKRAETAEAIEAEPQPLPTGPFRVIAADPPWKYFLRDEDATHRGTVGYPPMTVEEICALPVAEMAHEDCILWLWTTNALMHDAFHVLETWGFTAKTILTWVKPSIGAGHWLRGQTEHCILATKGKPTVMLTNQSTFIEGKVREHSRKPEEFYALVESLCPGSKVEMFARQPREGWISWGAESEKFAAATA
jgi:N6-adenosine-specific RNA methylase IME4